MPGGYAGSSRNRTRCSLARTTLDGPGGCARGCGSGAARLGDPYFPLGRARLPIRRVAPLRSSAWVLTGGPTTRCTLQGFLSCAESFFCWDQWRRPPSFFYTAWRLNVGLSKRKAPFESASVVSGIRTRGPSAAGSEVGGLNSAALCLSSGVLNWPILRLVISNPCPSHQGP